MKRFTLHRGRALGFAFCILGLMLISPLNSSAQQQSAISFGTSSVGGAFYTLSIVIGNVIGKHAGVAITVEPVGGSDATARGIGAKKVEMGMVNASSAAHAIAGVGSFSKGGKIELSLIAQGQDSLRQIVVRKDRGIKTVKDLSGKKFIGKRRALPEIEEIMNLLFELYGVNRKEVKIIETAETNEAIEAIKVGTVDGAMAPGGVPASYFLDLARSTDVEFLSIPEDKLKAVIDKMGSAYHVGIIPPNTYKGQEQAVKTPAMSAAVVAAPSLPEETVYRITKAIFTHQNEIATGHAGGKDWTLEKTLQDPPIPFHPGAIRYFKEVGVWKGSSGVRKEQ